MPYAAIDNDVLIKLAAYRLIESGLAALGDGSAAVVLGAAPFVVPSAINGHEGIDDKPGALAAWQAAVDVVEVVEPTHDEVALAARLEEAAARLGLPFDFGESQLCAIVVARGLELLVTGDKRAITSLVPMWEECDEVGSLRGAVLCLEQVVHRLVGELGPEQVRVAICTERLVDRSLTACMGCAAMEQGIGFDTAGLESYIADLQDRAEGFLVPGG